MRSIFIFFLLLIAFFFLSRHLKWAFFKCLILAFFVCLVIEIFSYGCLVSLVYGGRANFYFIGNQGPLDELLKSCLIEKIVNDRNSVYGTYEIDDRLGFTVSHDKWTYQYKTTNRYGMRSDHEYGFIPPEDVLRMVALGDSFVFCDGELTQNCWTYDLESAVHHLEVLNFGVSGYGLGQSYLRYINDALKFFPDFIVLNYTSITARDALNLKGILSGALLNEADLYRPVFWMDGDELRSKTIIPFDLFHKDVRERFIYRPAGIPFEQTIWANPFFCQLNTFVLIKQAVLPRILGPQAVDHFYSPQQGQVLNFKILENLFKIARKNKTQVLFTNTSLDKLPADIRSLMVQNGDMVRVFDIDQILQKLFSYYGVKRKELLNSSNHYNPKGNAIYAQALTVLLSEGNWGMDNRKFRFDKSKDMFVRGSLP